MKHRNLTLTILFVLVFFCFPCCSDKETPSPKAAEEYFLEKCIRYLEKDRLSDLRKNFRIDFEILNTDQRGEEYTLEFRSEIEHLTYDSLHPKV